MLIEKPLVSVVIPTYRRSALLSRAIISVLDQTYPTIELLVVDDNGIGTDDQIATEESLRTYIETSRIKYLKHRINQNGSAARNTGLRACNGKYVCFLDDDDYWMPESVEVRVDAMESVEDKSVGGSFSPLCYIVTRESGLEEKRPATYYKEGNVCKDFLTGKALFNTSGVLFRRDVLFDLDGFNESFIRHQDYELMIRFFRTYSLKLASSSPLYYMDVTSPGSHGAMGKNRLNYEYCFLQVFKPDLIRFDCYHQFSHMLYWQCAIEQLKARNMIVFIKSVSFSLLHGLITFGELKEFVSVVLKRQV